MCPRCGLPFEGKDQESADAKKAKHAAEECDRWKAFRDENRRRLREMLAEP